MKPEHITAWALDEASAEERERLETELRDNPNAKQAADETKDFCHFLLAELRDESLALTDEQRERLSVQPVAQSSRLPHAGGTLAPRSQWRTGVVRLALAACVVLGGFWTWSLVESRRDEKAVADTFAGNEVHQIQIKGRSNEEAQVLLETPLWKEQTEVAAPLTKPAPEKKLAAAPALKPSPETPRLLMLNAGQSTMTTKDVEELKKIQDRRAYGLNYEGKSEFDPPMLAAAPGQVGNVSSMSITGSGGATYGDKSAHTLNGGANFGSLGVGASSATLDMSGQVALPVNGPASGLSLPQAVANTLIAEGAKPLPGNVSVTGGGFIGGASTTAKPASPPAVMNSLPSNVNRVSKELLMAGSSTEIGNYDAAISQYQSVLRTDPHNAAARRGMETAEKKSMEYFKAAADDQRAKMLAQVDEAWEEKVPISDAYYLGKEVTAKEADRITAQKKREQTAGESYTRIIENELKDVAREPLSTFSIDVDTAAYANVRRFLNQGMIPPPDAVRNEELVNYFPTAEEGPAPTAKEPFGVRVELAPCPWQPTHRLARIAIKGRELGNERKNSNLVFLVDVSGSMNEPSKLPLVQQSLRMLTEQLGEGDRVTMVVYAGSSGLVLPPTNGEKKGEILAAIDKLQAGGSTHGSAGIQLAYEQAVAGFIKDGVNRVILCTDGDFNVGVSSPEELEKLITKEAKSGVFLSVLGFGSGNLKDRTMETLADKGNGNYAYIDSLSEARKVLVEQMSGTLVTIAKDVKIQVEFNPSAVRSYRLIGYENRMLAKEDFNDDTKDAGEIGAGHSVVALYEVVPSNLPPGAEPRPAVDGLKYQTPVVAPAQLAEAAKSGEMMTVKLRYKAPDSDLSKLIEVPVKDEGKTLTASSEEYKFSAAVVGFGLLLRDSGYKGALSWETVRRLALDGKGADKLGYRGEFLQLIDKARGLKGQ